MGLHGLHLVHSKAWEKHHELPIYGVRSRRQMNRLISKLSQFQQATDRLQQLVYEMKIYPQAFSGDQVIALSSYFPGTEFVLALHLLDHHFFGLRCDQAGQLLHNIGLYPQKSSYPAQQNPPSNFKSQLKSRPRLEDEIDIPSTHHEHGHD